MLTKLYTYAQAYLTKEDGATAIEYGLIAAGIAVAIAAVVFLLGDDLEALFTSVSTELQSAGS
jgi:pilus assembly protein Flp/PilA